MACRQLFYDGETGEVVSYTVNDETGEPSGRNSPVFTSREAQLSATSQDLGFRKGYSTNSKEFLTLKANIIARSNTVSHRMLLIPVTVLFFPAVLCVILIVLEIYLHIRCHRKNKNLKIVYMYYQSPFHIVTSIFCGACRESKSSCRVAQLQDQRRNRYDYLRGMHM